MPNWKHTVHVLAKAQYNLTPKLVDAILRKHRIDHVTQDNVTMVMGIIRRYRDPETDKPRRRP
jgi:hypothetical protein